MHWLGYRRYADTGLLWAAGVCATLEWISNTRDAPVTQRDERTVTAELAKAEMWTATAVDGADRNLPLESICADLGLAYCPPIALTNRGLEACTWDCGG
jgi:hypothetical protein